MQVYCRGLSEALLRGSRLTDTRLHKATQHICMPDSCRYVLAVCSGKAVMRIIMAYSVRHACMQRHTHGNHNLTCRALLVLHINPHAGLIMPSLGIGVHTPSRRGDTSPQRTCPISIASSGCGTGLTGSPQRAGRSNTSRSVCGPDGTPSGKAS